ncbi:MAG: hypothetical protein U1E39_00715 [Planctomycetota bacterium]
MVVRSRLSPERASLSTGIWRGVRAGVAWGAELPAAPTRASGAATRARGVAAKSLQRRPRPEAELLMAVRKAVARRITSFRRQLGANYRGVGLGFRVRGRGQARRREAELVVRVFVAKKVRRPDRRTHGRTIPPGFWVAVRDGRSVTRRWIRTDVEAARKGRPQAADAELDVYRSSSTNSPKRGSACCFVRVKGESDLHVLSCKHMLGHPVDEFAQAGTPFRIDLGRRQESVSTATRCSEWDPSRANVSRDVGVGALVDAERSRSPLRGLGVTDVVFDLDEFIVMSFGDQLELVSRNGTKQVQVVDVELDRELEGFKTAAGSVMLRFSNVVSYEGMTAADDPIEGDSGAAILKSDGATGRVLVGMHFWGDNASIGAAQFIGDVLDEGSVGAQLTFDPSDQD